MTSTGWKPMPLSLKILFVVMVLWMVGSLMNLPNLMQDGLPLVGSVITGARAALVVLALDIIGPVVFLYALWTRQPWGPKWAFGYIGLFVLNGFVALATVMDQIGGPAMAMPIVVSLIFLAVIYLHRGYFAGGAQN